MRGGWAGALEGGSLANILQIGEGQTCLILSRGRVTVFFWQGKYYSTSISCRLFVNKHLKLVYTSKATSQNESKLFHDTDVQEPIIGS